MSVTWLEWVRWLMMICCSEATVRYFWWWYQLRRDSLSLRPLMLGVALSMLSLTVFATYAIVYAAYAPLWEAGLVFRSEVTIFGDTAIAVAALLHLIPSWRICCQIPTWRLPLEVVARGALALCGAWLT